LSGTTYLVDGGGNRVSIRIAKSNWTYAGLAVGVNRVENALRTLDAEKVGGK
jgi:hypothetical protein